MAAVTEMVDGLDVVRVNTRSPSLTDGIDAVPVNVQNPKQATFIPGRGEVIESPSSDTSFEIDNKITGGAFGPTLITENPISKTFKSELVT